MDIIKIFEKIRKHNAENNAVKNLDPIKTKTFTETIDLTKSNSRIEPIELADAIEFINGSSIQSHINYGEHISTRGQTQPIIFFEGEEIVSIDSIDDFIRDNELD